MSRFNNSVPHAKSLKRFAAVDRSRQSFQVAPPTIDALGEEV